MDTVVSVIVPIYNVQPYLDKCVASILNQTNRDLEIILIDDGSTDGCSRMCDQYAASDERIHVIHQTNKGLSEARNSGIDKATGDYILFVDGDDWIEPNTVECLLNACVENNADASCCGHYKEFVDRTTTHPLTNEQRVYEGDEIVAPAMKGSFAHYAWEKLWKRELFDTCRFPPGMQFEDIATTWKLFLKCQRVVCIPDVLFHYIYRKNSIGNTKTMKNLSDRWIAFRERYDVMAGKNEELKQICTKGCLETIGYTWRWLWIVEHRDEEKIQEMRGFLRENRRYISCCPLETRISLFCALHSNSVTIASCYYLNQIYRRFRGLDQMAKMEGQKILGWQYYKHAMIPTTAPHEEPDLTPVVSGEIWKENKPLLVRWTTDWDCGYDTGWWYVIREGPFDLSELSASSRRNIRKALRNCRVEKIEPSEWVDDLWKVFNEAIVRYENYELPFDKDGFIREWVESSKDFWAGFDESGLMIGFAVFELHDEWVDYQVAKYSAQYLKLRVSDAINTVALDYYLNNCGKKYVSDGERSILHKTNVQTYLMEHFGYRKAYCRLHVQHRRALGVLIKALYPIRKTLKSQDGIQRVHKLNSLLMMEEIVRLDMGSMDET